MDLKALRWLDIARVDIKNHGNGNDVKVIIEKGNKCNIWKADWNSKCGNGYVMETSDQNLVMNLECSGAGTLTLTLTGVDRHAPSGDRLPLWVDYTRLAVNDEIVFGEVKPQCHDKSYFFKRPVSNGEKLKIEISWTLHGYKGEELAQLISLMDQNEWKIVI